MNNLEEKKDRLNELSRHIKLFLENNKYENSTRINLQTALFEQIIALIKIFISKNNNNIGKNELFERSFATLNSDILHYLKIENPIDVIIIIYKFFMTILLIILVVSVAKNSNDYL